MKTLAGTCCILIALFLAWVAYDLYLVAILYDRFVTWSLMGILAILSLICGTVAWTLMTGDID